MAQKSVLVVNVGNGTTRFGMVRDGEVQGTWSVCTPERLTADEACRHVRIALEELGEKDAPYGTVLSCVVPSLAHAWGEALRAVSQTRPVLVGPGVKTGIRLAQDDPSQVGSDRLADAVAAKALLGAPAIVVHLGTSTHIEVVGTSGEFAGGIIAPGLELAFRALEEAGARLPITQLHMPGSAIATNTQDAMCVGTILGEAARIDGLLDAVTHELGRACPIALTGRHAALIQPLLAHATTLEDALTLQGLALIWHANRS